MLAAYFDPNTQRLVLLPSGPMPAAGQLAPFPTLARPNDAGSLHGLPQLAGNDYFMANTLRTTGCAQQPMTLLSSSTQANTSMINSLPLYAPFNPPSASENDPAFTAVPRRKRPATSTSSDEENPTSAKYQGRDDDGCGDPKEKNRQAQRRFRARQKVLISGLKDDIEKMTTQAIRAELTITNLRNEVQALRQQLSQQGSGTWQTFHVAPAVTTGPSANSSPTIAGARMDSNAASDLTQVPISLDTFMQQFNLQPGSVPVPPVYLAAQGSGMQMGAMA